MRLQSGFMEKEDERIKEDRQKKRFYFPLCWLEVSSILSVPTFSILLPETNPVETSAAFVIPG